MKNYSIPRGNKRTVGLGKRTVKCPVKNALFGLKCLISRIKNPRPKLL